MNKDEPMTQVTFDLASILNVAHQGVRRAAIFLALGVNSARSPALSNYELSNLARLQFVPSGLGEDVVANFKVEFERWIASCGLRELIETYSVFLEHSHEACLAMTLAKGNSFGSHAKIQTDFENVGFSEKLKLLESKFKVVSNNSKYLQSINKFRNCLAHRLGIVEQRDCNGGDELVVQWIGLDLFMEKPSGEEVPISMPSPEGQVLEGPGTIKFRNKERMKRFKKGEVVSMSPHELAEVCRFFVDSSSEIHNSCVQYAESLGIKKV